MPYTTQDVLQALLHASVSVAAADPGSDADSISPVTKERLARLRDLAPRAQALCDELNSEDVEESVGTVGTLDFSNITGQLTGQQGTGAKKIKEGDCGCKECPECLEKKALQEAQRYCYELIGGKKTRIPCHPIQKPAQDATTAQAPVAVPSPLPVPTPVSEPVANAPVAQPAAAPTPVAGQAAPAAAPVAPAPTTAAVPATPTTPTTPAPATPTPPEPEPEPEPEKPLSEKAARAKKAHKLVDAPIQRYAEDYNEPRFARVVGGVPKPDNEPTDVEKRTEDGKITDGIEMKTLILMKDDPKKSKITMDSYAQVRKVLWEREHGATFHTVVSDDRQVINAKGDGQHDDSKRVYLYRRGVAGSARLSSLYRCEGDEELLKLMEMPEEELPEGAKRTDGDKRKGDWLPVEADEQGRKGFKNTETGEVVRAKPPKAKKPKAVKP